MPEKRFVSINKKSNKKAQKSTKKTQSNKRVQYIRVYDHLTKSQIDVLGEVANISMGTAATSMSCMLETIDISTPALSRIDVGSVRTFDRMFDSPLDTFIRIAFDISIDNRIRSSMIQLYPIQFAVDMCNLFRKSKLDKKKQPM